MQHRHTLGFCIGLLLLLTSCSGKVSTPNQPAPTPDETGKTIGRSANWKVEVVPLKKAKDPDYGPSKDLSRMFLKLKIEYLGPTGPVNVPLIYLLHRIDVHGEKPQESKGYTSGLTVDGSTDSEAYKLATWLFIGQAKSLADAENPPAHETMQLETGKKFEANLDFRYWDWDAGNFRLLFADIEPIRFTGW